MENKLKPCKKCGSKKGVIWGFSDFIPDDRDAQGRCPKCGYKTRKYGTVDMAIEAWNRRAK